jgi:signal transduction histidine kinase
MTTGATFPLVAAAVDAVVALVWAVLAVDFWRVLRLRRPQSLIYRILPMLTSLVAFHYALFVLNDLTPTKLGGHARDLHGLIDVLIDLGLVALVAVVRHMTPAFFTVDARPSRAWLAVNYGLAAAVAATIAARVVVRAPSSVWVQFWVVQMTYLVVVALLGFRDLRRVARPGHWLPGALGEARRFDVIMIALTLVTLFGAIAIQVYADQGLQELMRGSASPASVLALVLHATFGLTFAAMFVVRTLGRFSQQLPVALAMLGAAAGAVFGVPRLTARLAHPEARHVVQAAAVAALLVIVLPGQAWLARALDRVVFRRSHRRWAELEAFLATLPPELGVSEICRRLLAEATRVLRLRGAALLLTDGATLAEGRIATAPLVRAWTQDDAGLPTRPILGASEAGDLAPALREALIEAEVVCVLPVASPRGRRGHLFLSSGLMGAPFSDEDRQAVTAFADRLALALDGADLLARAAAVERSLAHAEKLAAIGELTARVAHEIRNPVAAARSLSQQLARAPGTPFAEEHGLILGELDRVERQVAGLLRFARRDELRLEAVELASLVREACDALGARLGAAGIEVELDVPGAVAARGDREKLRQVLLNLIENAIDALAASDGARRLRVAAASTNGSATVEVADSGPGVPAEALARLFDPFFSTKPHGTGLGLAIVKRTVEAHGGRITAAGAPGTGLCVRVELPLAERAA